MGSVDPSEDVPSDAYDRQISHLRKVQDWQRLIDYCRQVEQRLRVQVLRDLQITYVIVHQPEQELKAALAAHDAGRKFPLDAYGRQASFLCLAHAYQHNGQGEKARDMLACALTCVLTVPQAEYIRIGLLERAGLEEQAGNQASENILRDVAERMRKVRRWANRSEAGREELS